MSVVRSAGPVVAEQHRLQSLVSYIGHLLLAAGLSLVPRPLLKRMVTRRLRRVYNATIKHIYFFKSGRSALTALFQAVLDGHPEAVVLLPDYICDVVYRAAHHADIEVWTYETDGFFQPNQRQLQHLIAERRVQAILFASIMGTQNNGQSLLDNIRATRPELVVIFDECQNLITSSPLVVDSRTAVVLSFNSKNLPGALGGALGFSCDFLDLSSPPAWSLRQLVHEIRIWGASAKQVGRMFRRCVAPQSEGGQRYPHPRIEHSVCSFHYRVDVQAIAKLSLGRALVGLWWIHQIETQREKNYHVFASLIGSSIAGDVVDTDRPHLAPYLPVQLRNRAAFGRLPFKGPYAIAEDPTVTLRPNLYAIKNQGWLVYRVGAEG
jgi:hypothetical protein